MSVPGPQGLNVVSALMNYVVRVPGLRYRGTSPCGPQSRHTDVRLSPFQDFKIEIRVKACFKSLRTQDFKLFNVEVCVKSSDIQDLEI